ncbi:MAG: LamG-like jellyroll fold domain-containing protein [Verrucomicrobiota bacterium]
MVFLLGLLAAWRAAGFTPQFPLKDGWLGGDTVASIPLDGRHTILWLFSDTYVRQDTGTNRNGAGLVHNSLAVTSWNGDSTNIEYYIRGRDQGAMTSIFPSPGSDTNGAWWYWVQDGFKYNGKVYVFLPRFRNTGAASGALSGFQEFAVDLAVMGNVDSEPNPLLWPLSIERDVLVSTNISPGISTYVDAAGGYVYLWGADDTVVSGFNYRSFLLFRIPLTGLENPGVNLQYYTTNHLWAGSSGSTLSDALAIMTDGAPDFSIRYHPDLKKYVDIQVDDGFPASYIWERTSSSPTNGWPSGAGATTLMTLADEPGYVPWPVFYYAAKEHFEFYSPVTGRALLTYVGNSAASGGTSPTNVLDNNSLYVPITRWVQLGASNVDQPPNVCAITSPTNGQNFQGPANLTVSVNAGDPDTNDSIVLVNVFLDGVLAASTGTLPFNCPLPNVEPGSHALYAEAYDTAENKTTSATINISVPPFAITQYAAQVIADSPLYYWRFNETNGSAIAYGCENRLDATYGANTTNGIPGVPNPPFYGLETTNKGVAMNNSVSAAGAGFVTAPALNLNTNAVTILAWLHPNAHITGAEGVVFSRNSTHPIGVGYLGIRFPEDEIGYTWNQDNANTYYWPSKLFVPPSQWSFVALTIAPTQAILYLGTNGVLLSATNSIAHDVEPWDGPTAIGADTLSVPGTVFDGQMDEVAVFNHTLSPAQIATLYTTALVGGPVALSWQASGTNLVLSWLRGTLLQAPNLVGPWTPNSSATSPYTLVPGEAQMFYRTRQ